VIAPGPAPDPGAVRLAVPHPFVDQPLSAEVGAGWERFLVDAADAGITIVHVDVPEIDFPGLVIEATYPEAAAVHRRRFEAEPERYGPDVAERIRLALDNDMDDYLAGLAWRLRVRDAAETVLDGCDALLTPTVAALRKVIGIETIEIDGEEVFYRGLMSCFTTMANQTGQPALSLPLLQTPSPGAPPPSIQLIGRQWNEHRLLELGTMMEKTGLVGSSTPPGWD
jgi:Asp-tRNA(Asn)/Glu-tRNA(Gln) amidotransferase A subunit family amidase